MKTFFFFFWRALALVFLVLGLGLKHSCPWPRECLSSERLSLALASDFFCVLGLGLGLEPCVLDSTSVIFQNLHLPECTFLSKITFPRKLIFQNLHLPECTFGRYYISLKAYFPEFTLARMYIWPKLHFPERLFARIYTKQNLHLVETTFSRKLILQKLHFLKNSFSRNYFSFEKLYYVQVIYF